MRTDERSLMASRRDTLSQRWSAPATTRSGKAMPARAERIRDYERASTPRSATRGLSSTSGPAPDVRRRSVRRVDIQPIPLPRDCQDWMLGSFWAHPARVLDPEVRNATSGSRGWLPTLSLASSLDSAVTSQMDLGQRATAPCASSMSTMSACASSSQCHRDLPVARARNADVALHRCTCRPRSRRGTRIAHRGVRAAVGGLRSKRVSSVPRARNPPRQVRSASSRSRGSRPMVPPIC